MGKKKKNKKERAKLSSQINQPKKSAVEPEEKLSEEVVEEKQEETVVEESQEVKDSAREENADSPNSDSDEETSEVEVGSMENNSDTDAELAEQKDKYLRLMAEFDNYKRRTSKEYEKLVESANKKLMLDIIEVRENFNRALTMTESNKDFDKFFEGMQLIFNKLDENLTKNGLTVFAEVGDEFDPEIHEAMMKAPHEEVEEDHITQIYEHGYKLKKQVIKHAKVIVSAGNA